MNKMTCLFPGFSGGPSAPAPLPPPPTEDDPAVTQAKKDLRLSESRRKGRASTILTSGRGVEEGLGAVNRAGTLG